MTAGGITLGDGTRVLIRPIEPEDRAALAEGFDRLSAESRYRRFFGPMKALSERDLDRLTQVDHADHEALVAVLESSGEGIGVARYVRTGPEEAEPAVVVADAWQRHGLASKLLGALAERAVEEGVVRFRAPVLAQNRAAIAVLRQLGESETTHLGREVELSIELVPHTAPPPRLLALLRAVAAGTLAPGRSLLARIGPLHSGPPDRSRLRDTIVVGTDGSPEAAAAVRAAAELAPRIGASVQLVAVHWPVVGDRAEMDAVLDEASGVLEAAGVQVACHVRRGDPAASLMDVAGEERARLILVGPRGEGGAATRLLLGTVSGTVAAHAPCDVMIVRERG